jgi:hypothetical protein
LESATDLAAEDPGAGLAAEIGGEQRLGVLALGLRLDHAGERVPDPGQRRDLFG